MVFELPDLLLSITAITNIGLLWFVYERDRKSPANKLFSLFVISACFWSIVILLFRLVNYDLIAIYLMKFSYISALFIGYTFYQFSLLFPKPSSISHIHKVLIRTLAIGLGIFLLIPNILTLDIIYHTWGKEVLLDPVAYWVFAICFLFFFITGQLRLFLKIPETKGVEKVQLIIISLTVTVIGAFGTYYNLVLPSPFYQNFQYIWTGPVLSLIFAVTITYTIFRFKVFNPRAIVSELLVYVLLLFLFIRLVISTSTNELLINSVALIITGTIGILLIRSITQEDRQKELIEKQKYDLEIANEGQANLIHIINHQIKGYLSKSRNIFSELLTGDYGQMPDPAKPMLDEGLKSLTEGVMFVQQVLNSSSAEQGTLTYKIESLNFKDLIVDVTNKERKIAEEKHLQFDVHIDDAQYLMTGDSTQLKEALRNLIENSIIYTPSGKIDISLKKTERKIIFRISDTGVGLSDDDKERLFIKGGRGKDSIKINVNSTGYGLAFTKAVVEAHKGTISASSEGRNKGSTFTVELPIA